MARKKAIASDAESDNSFPFIISNGPGVTKDPALRTLIRKQAMKDVGLARKRRGNHGRTNMRQDVVFEQADDQIEEVVPIRSASSHSSGSSESTPETCSTTTTFELDMDDPANWTVACQSTTPQLDIACTLPWSLTFDTGYERARSRFRVDLTQLTMMTHFNMSKFAMDILSVEPSRLLALMQDKQWSYLEYVPSMYETSKPLAAATDSLLAKVSKVIAPYTPDDGLDARLYTKALRALQDAIASPSSACDAETLGAIQLMQLHELLEPDREVAWTSHLKGAQRLVRYRTAKQFKTEFEKALFAGHVGPTVSEALMDNEHTYLAEKEWLDLYSSIIEDSPFLTERSELVVNSRKLMILVPGIWHDADTVLRGDDLFDDDALRGLEVQCRKVHAGYLDWLEQYKSYCLRTSLSQPSMREIAMRREIFGASLECLCIVKRLLASLCDSDRPTLEDEAQALAKFLMQLQNQLPSPNHSWLFTMHEVGVAKSIEASKEWFEEDVRDQSIHSRKLAMRNRYITWDGKLRKVH